MSGIGTRSKAPKNTFSYRHPLFFEDEALYPEWHRQAKEHAAYLAAHAEWEESRDKAEKAGAKFKTKEPVLVPAPKLDQYKDTDRDSFIRFRKSKVNSDTEDMTGIIAPLNVDWDALVEQYLAKQKLEIPRIDIDPKSWQRCQLVLYCVELHGPYFTVDPDYTVEDFTGSGDAEEMATRNPYAGQTMPIDPLWFNLLKQEVIDDATVRLSMEHARRTPSEEESFPQGVISLADAKEVSDKRRNSGAGQPSVS